jgi:UDP-N-acetylglucosamine--N-acetylmuramyl-(pentapeptide) pyrophosphoryl-undecaprenol N-acetylglucosamine transferase
MSLDPAETGKSVRVIFAGGGTGGHVYPALAMYEGLCEERGDDSVAALFIGVKGGLESSLFSSRGVDFRLLPGRGLRGASLVNKLRTPFDLIEGVSRSLGIIREFKPDVVVGTGGYASVSMVVAAIFTRTPRVLQEQNSVPGLVNRRLSRFADLVLLSFEESLARIPAGVRTAVIGNPLRRAPESDRRESAAFFGLDPGRPTVLVIGGSRGAVSLNRAAVDAAGVLLDETDTQFILLTGRSDYENIRSQIGTAYPGRVAVRAYLEEVHHAYRASDVAVARAGASSVFELASYGVPAIFVPYPYAADDHQRLNARPLEQAGAAVVVDDSRLDGPVLAGQLRLLLENPQRRAEMTVAMETWVKKDAARAAAGKILSLVENTRGHSEQQTGKKGNSADLRNNRTDDGVKMLCQHEVAL